MIEFILVLGFLIAVGHAILVAQMVALARLFRSQAWVLMAFGFLIAGGRTVWAFIQLPAAILRSAAAEHLPAHMTLKHWLGIVSTLAVLVLIIAGLDRLRRDLRNIGY